jgi:hypothetical protein
MATKTQTTLKRMGSDFDSYHTPKGLRLAVSEHDGALWVTNIYYLARFERVASMFADFNLQPEPGRYLVNGSVSKYEGAAPRLASIIPAYVADHETGRASIAGRVVTVEIDGRPHYVWEKVGPKVERYYVRRDFFDFCAGDDPFVTTMADGKPVALWTPDDHELIGLIMPVRVSDR